MGIEWVSCTNSYKSDYQYLMRSPYSPLHYEWMSYISFITDHSLLFSFCAIITHRTYIRWLLPAKIIFFFFFCGLYYFQKWCSITIGHLSSTETEDFHAQDSNQTNFTGGKKQKHSKVVVWVRDCKEMLTTASFTLNCVCKDRDFNS